MALRNNRAGPGYIHNLSSSSKAPSNNSSGSEVSETPFWLSDKKEQAKGASSTLSEKNLVALAIETESSMQASVIDKGADAASDKTLSPKVSSYQLGGSYEHIQAGTTPPSEQTRSRSSTVLIGNYSDSPLEGLEATSKDTIQRDAQPVPDAAQGNEDEDDLFDEFFDDLSPVDDEAIRRAQEKELETQQILAELFADPPYPVGAVFEDKHAARIAQDVAEYIPEYDEQISMAESSAPFPEDWATLRRFQIPATQRTSASGKVSIAPAAATAKSEEQTFIESTSSGGRTASIKPTAPIFRPTSSASSHMQSLAPPSMYSTASQIGYGGPPGIPATHEPYHMPFNVPLHPQPYVSNISTPPGSPVTGYWQPNAFDFRTTPQAAPSKPKVSKAIPIKSPENKVATTQSSPQAPSSTPSSLKQRSSAPNAQSTVQDSTSVNLRTAHASTIQAATAARRSKDEAESSDSEAEALIPEQSHPAGAKGQIGLAQRQADAQARSAPDAQLKGSSKETSPSAETKKLENEGKGFGWQGSLKSLSSDSEVSRTFDKPQLSPEMAEALASIVPPPTPKSSTVPSSQSSTRGPVSNSTINQKQTVPSAISPVPASVTSGTQPATSTTVPPSIAPKLPSKPAMKSQAPATKVSSTPRQSSTRGRLLFEVQLKDTDALHSFPLYEFDDPTLLARELLVKYKPGDKGLSWSENIVKLYHKKLERLALVS